ncbi:GNAT family N-acetyltransferase [Hahella ganghwensis]|uniref:GNAT family N-acetyltransferase n=1 Tax=Hahella ganghwensis TaxID=286420 RepID=UPI000367A249|nr:GNAT family N-acetyltransferase [Hahella ganghwensis]
MDNKGSYRIRNASMSELHIMLDWAAAEGWNPGLDDAEAYYVADCNGFFIGFLDDQPVACISAVKYTSAFGFIGFYIVKPEFRGQKYGFQIWNRALEYLKGCNIGLDGVVEQQSKYRKSGFNLAYQNIRYEGRGRGIGTVAGSPQIQDLTEVSTDMLLSYDHKMFPVEREAFITSWIGQSHARASGYVEGDQLAGYGVIRKCRQGYKIGPLFADSPVIAEQLFEALVSSVEETALVYLDIPRINEAALKLVDEYQMQPVFETARMYTGTAPAIDMNCLYGVTSFEIG